MEEKLVHVNVNESFILKTDANELCRLCANQDNQLIPIYKGEGLEHNISNKIEKHLPIIKVSELDKLPLQICYQCASTLIAWHNLYESCGVADKKLREILKIEKFDEDETYEHYIDDYSEDYDVQAETPVAEQSSTSKLFNETETAINTAADERCLRWDTYQTTVNVDCDRANMPGIRSNAVLSAPKDDAINIVFSDLLAAEIEYQAGNSLTNKKCMFTLCECVWNRETCAKCLEYDSFRCSYCPMVFLSVEMRNRHLRTSHKSNLLRDSVHLFRGHGTSMSELADEASSKNDEEPAVAYQCNECFQVFEDKVSLLGHLETHAPEKIGPSRDHTMKLRNRILTSADIVARATLKGPSKLRVQRRTRTCKSEKYECEHCADVLYSKVSLRKHFLVVHNYKIQNASSGSSDTSTGSKLTKTITDELAKNSFKSARSTAEDGNTGYYTCADCGQIFLKRHSFTRHVNLHSANRYDCDKCKKTFISEFARNTHQSRKHKELPKNVFFLNGRKYLKCEQCFFTCRNEKNRLEEHMRVHTGEKPFTCELCGKQFRTKALLRVHRKFVHEGVKEHACDFCGRCFSNKRYMEEHRRIHTGEKPLICDLCGKTFRQNSSLSKHVENHLGIKRFVCHLCGKRFTNSHHLNIHIKRHMGETSHVCNQCGKGFVDQYQLKNHYVVHSEERPFVCLLCGTGFKLLKHLKQHGKTHRTT